MKKESEAQKAVTACLSLLAFGGGIVWCLVEYVDAKVANAPWVIERPYVLKQENDRHSQVMGRIDKLSKSVDRIEEKLDRIIEREVTK